MTFTVVATDSGDPPLSGTAEVIVRVLNSSQQQLRFRTSYIYGEIVENTRTFQSGSGVLVLNIAVGAGTPFSFAPNYTTNPFVLLPGNTVRNILVHDRHVCQLCTLVSFICISTVFLGVCRSWSSSLMKSSCRWVLGTVWDWTGRSKTSTLSLSEHTALLCSRTHTPA